MLFDRVKCTIAGSDNADRSILLGAAVPGFRTFAQAGVPDAAAVSYVIEDGNAFEVGTGRYSAGANRMVRIAISSNSNNDAAPINISSSAVVFISALASDIRVGRMAGEIKQVAFAHTPEGWAECLGQALDRGAYPDLFAMIGTTFGAGDGNTTFNVPDYRDRVAIGVGAATALGQTGGAKEVTLSAEQAPPILVATTNTGDDTVSSPSAGLYLGNVLDVAGGAGQPAIYAVEYGQDLGLVPIGKPDPEPVPIMPPFVGVRHIIALTHG